MTTNTQKQHAAHQFLLAKFKTQDAFTKEEFSGATGWDGSTLRTYWSKQFKPLLIEGEQDSYRVSEVFRRFIEWPVFQQHVSQVRNVSTDYMTLAHDNVILFDFFMPLNNEGNLRTALDALFYKDAVLARLNAIGDQKLEERFPKEEGETQGAWHDRICNFVSDVFGGYSITHVNGRYRAKELSTVAEAYQDAENVTARYLVDETTAMVRFIFPCGEPKKIMFLSSAHYFEDLEGEDDAERPLAEAALIRWFFYELFVQSIVQVVNGEDEIWMLESGMRSRLHIWRVQG